MLKRGHTTTIIITRFYDIIKLSGVLSTTLMERHLVREPLRHKIVARRIENVRQVLIHPKMLLYLWPHLKDNRSASLLTNTEASFPIIPSTETHKGVKGLFWTSASCFSAFFRIPNYTWFALKLFSLTCLHTFVHNENFYIYKYNRIRRKQCAY